MIARLTGAAVVRQPDRLIIDVGGVGYEVLISLQTFAALPAADPVSLHVHTHVREAEITLFGFAAAGEKTLFQLLQTVSGIGPRLAMAILSGLPVQRLAAAIRNRNLAALVTIPGVGKRTAERMITELSEKVDALAGAPEVGVEGGDVAVRADARMALLNLGYPEQAVERALEQVLGGAIGAGRTLEEALRESLKALSRA